LAGAVVLASVLLPVGPGLAATGGAGLAGGPTSLAPPASHPSKPPKRKKRTKKKAPNAAPALPGDSKHLGDRILRQGMSGHDVRVLQSYLSIVGFPTSVDGSFGASTRTSVIAFQRSQNMSASGVVTVRVELALRAAVARIESQPPVGTTRINGDGTATAPAGAPAVVNAAIAAANRIIHTSYCYAGGHASWNSSCYDCSGAVSFVLHGAGLLSSPEDSTDLESYGAPGPGRWITIYADPAHTWIVVGGRAFDTADFGGPNIPGGTGPRWRSNPTGNLADGGNYIVRHPTGL
jgi:peptidoglycan hydrolase-like protein with peptidoglycan-binding domain